MKKLSIRRETFLYFCAFSVIATMLFLAIFGNDGYSDYLKLSRNSQNLKDQVRRIQEQNKALLAEIKDLKDKDGKKVEQLARVNFGMVRKGETIYVLNTPKKLPVSGK
jgi:cell division protein FtsB